METGFGGPSGEEAIAAMGVGLLLFFLFIMAVSVVLTIVIWWKIFSKAGYSGALGLLILVPFGELILLIVLAFGKWPALQELARLRQQLNQPRQ